MIEGARKLNIDIYQAFPENVRQRLNYLVFFVKRMLSFCYERLRLPHSYLGEEMKKLVMASIIAAAFNAEATLLTFDDVPGGSIQNSYGAMPVYKGFVFRALSKVNHLDWVDTVSTKYPFGAVSGDFTLINNYGGGGAITAADLSHFTFDGLWVKTGQTKNLRASAVGYDGGVVVWEKTFTLTTNFIKLGGMAGQINELRLNFGDFFLVDDLSLNGAVTSTVPEPSSLALISLGLMSVGVARRRKQKTF